MKKWLSFALILALVVLLPATVMAKPADAHVAQNKVKAHAVLNVKLPVYHVTGGTSDQVDDDNPYKGHITVTTPRGANNLIIRGVIDELKKETEYSVWVRKLSDYTGTYLNHSGNYYQLVLFKTDADGHGSFHLKIADKDLPAGTYELQVAINEGSSTVAATKKWLEIKVK
ncbi:MAG: hypothetical protein EOM08_03290 [Clostridia bacterium]|nr:hypothetical protein [Clostridia bacterium]NCC75441.1 hypothetical protein [Clostridia bacterium]